MVSDAFAASCADEFWLLTTRAEPRRTPPQSVRNGVAAAAIYDLAVTGEVSWTGSGEKSYLLVRDACDCADGTERTWHGRLIGAAGGRAMAARFCLGPLIPDAWHEVAARLVARHAADEVESRIPIWGKPIYRVGDEPAVRRRHAQLARTLRRGLGAGRDHDLVAIAWASGCLDDLFNIHGLSVSADLTEAARQAASGDALSERLEAALMYSAVLPTPPML